MPIAKLKSFTRNIFRSTPSWRAFFGIVLLAPLLTGCFTVLQHPRLERGEAFPDEITHTDRCTACHAQMATYWYTNPYELVAPYSFSDLSDWDYYYHYPWWLRDRFLKQAYVYGDSAAEVIPVNRRQFGRRNRYGAYLPPVSSEPPSNSGLGISSAPGRNCDAAGESPASTPSMRKRSGLDSPASTGNKPRTRKKKDD